MRGFLVQKFDELYPSLVSRADQVRRLYVDENGYKVEGPRMMKGQTQPARHSARVHGDTLETTAFANRRDKRRRQREIAKASRKKNRK
jgi:hypothetical protein